MKVWVYSHLKNSPGNDLIGQEAVRRGHDFELIEPATQSLPIGSALENRPDLVYTRIGSAAPASAFARLTILEQSGVPCFNSSVSLQRCRDKVIAYGLLAAAGLPIPRTSIAGSAYEISDLSGPPWIVKLSVGTKGQGVCLVESERSLRSVLDALRHSDQTLLVQEFIPEAKGADIRVVVLGGKAKLAAKRQAQDPSEFRSNLYMGGHSQRVELTDEMRTLAESATSALGLDIAGVDLLQARDGLLIVEVNGSPGLTASADLPALVMDFLEERAP